MNQITIGILVGTYKYLNPYGIPIGYNVVEIENFGRSIMKIIKSTLQFYSIFIFSTGTYCYDQFYSILFT